MKIVRWGCFGVYLPFFRHHRNQNRSLVFVSFGIHRTSRVTSRRETHCSGCENLWMTSWCEKSLLVISVNVSFLVTNVVVIYKRIKLQYEFSCYSLEMVLLSLSDTYRERKVCSILRASTTKNILLKLRVCFLFEMTQEHKKDSPNNSCIYNKLIMCFRVNLHAQLAVIMVYFCFLSESPSCHQLKDICIREMTTHEGSFEWYREVWQLTFCLDKTNCSVSIFPFKS